MGKWPNGKIDNKRERKRKMVEGEAEAEGEELGSMHKRC